MKIVRPVYIDDYKFVSSSVSEDDYDIYSNTATYSTGDRVIITDGVHKIYESLKSSNTNKYPPDNVGGTDPYWFEISSTNKWKMFDDIVNTQTVNTGTIYAELTPGRINTIALLNIEANEAHVEMIVDGETVYNTTKDLILDNVNDWYEYFFEDIIKKTDVVFDDLPIYGDALVKVTLDNGLNDAKCGMFINGLYKFIGVTLWGASPSILDFSRTTTDVFGNTSFIKRGNAKRLEVDLFIDNEKIDEVYRLSRVYTSIPVLWIGTSKFTSTILYGFFRAFNPVIASPAGSECSITIEGLL